VEGSDEERLDVLRRVNDAYNREDWDELKALAHPDAEIQRPGGFGVSSGRDEAVGRLEPEVMENQRVEMHDVEIRGDVALVEVTWTARGQGSGIELEQRSWNVYRFEGNLVRRLEIHLERDVAIEAAWG
jgi:ketosteroid isomerase-like protein